MPEEQDELVSIRGLVEGFQRTPLREFKGRLDSYTTELVTRFTPARTYVNLNYSEVEPIETTGEPYPFPIAQISLPLNKRRVSQWTILADSIAKLIPGDQDIQNTIGMIHHMKITPNHMMWNTDKGEATPREAWEVTEVVGEGMAPAKVDATGRALELLDGRVEEEWNQLVFQDQSVKKDARLIDDILHRRFLPAMFAAGRVTKDDNGVLHKVSSGSNPPEDIPF